MTICFKEEDEELEKVLKVSIEEPLCNPDLAREDGPMVLRSIKKETICSYFF